MDVDACCSGTLDILHRLLDPDHLARCNFVTESLSSTAWEYRSSCNLGLILSPVQSWYGGIFDLAVSAMVVDMVWDVEIIDAAVATSTSW